MNDNKKWEWSEEQREALPLLQRSLRGGSGLYGGTLPAAKTFVGRKEILSAVKNWMADAGSGNLAVIYGPPGSGKSSLMGAILSVMPGKTAGIICESDSEGDRKGRAFMSALALSLCEAFPPAVVPVNNLLREGLPEDARDAGEWFDILIAGPLRCCDDLPEGKTFGLLLDGLDAFEQDGDNPLARALVRASRHLPAGIKLLAASRRVPSVTAAFRQVPEMDILSGQEEDDENIRRYLSLSLKDMTEGDDKKALLEALCQESRHCFLYAGTLVRGIREGLVSADFPEGMGDMLSIDFARWTEQAFPDKTEYTDLYGPMLSVLYSLGRKETLPEEDLAEMFGLEKSQMRDFKNRLLCLSRQGRPDTPPALSWSLDEPLTRWLLSDDAGIYRIDPEKGLRLAVEKLLRIFSDKYEHMVLTETLKDGLIVRPDISVYQLCRLLPLLDQLGEKEAASLVRQSPYLYYKLREALLSTQIGKERFLLPPGRKKNPSRENMGRRLLSGEGGEDFEDALYENFMAVLKEGSGQDGRLRLLKEIDSRREKGQISGTREGMIASLKGEMRSADRLLSLYPGKYAMHIFLETYDRAEALWKAEYGPQGAQPLYERVQSELRRAISLGGPLGEALEGAVPAKGTDARRAFLPESREYVDEFIRRVIANNSQDLPTRSDLAAAESLCRECESMAAGLDERTQDLCQWVYAFYLRRSLRDQEAMERLKAYLEKRGDATPLDRRLLEICGDICEDREGEEECRRFFIERYSRAAAGLKKSLSGSFDKAALSDYYEEFDALKQRFEKWGDDVYARKCLKKALSILKAASLAALPDAAGEEASRQTDTDIEKRVLDIKVSDIEKEVSLYRELLRLEKQMGLSSGETAQAFQDLKASCRNQKTLPGYLRSLWPLIRGVYRGNRAEARKLYQEGLDRLEGFTDELPYGRRPTSSFGKEDKAVEAVWQYLGHAEFFTAGLADPDREVLPYTAEDDKDREIGRRAEELSERLLYGALTRFGRPVDISRFAGICLLRVQNSLSDSEAEKACQRGVSLLEKAGEKGGFRRAAYELLEAYAKRMKHKKAYGEACLKFREAAEVYASSQNGEGAVKAMEAYTQAAEMARLIPDPEEAILCEKKAAQCAREAAMDGALSEYLCFGECESLSRKLLKARDPEALYYASFLLDIVSLHEDGKEGTSTIYYRAKSLKTVGDEVRRMEKYSYRHAIDYYYKAAELLEKISENSLNSHEKKTYADIQAKLGDYYMRRRAFREAASHLEKCMRLMGRMTVTRMTIPELRLMIGYKLVYGGVLDRLEQTKNADSEFQDAQEMLEAALDKARPEEFPEFEKLSMAFLSEMKRGNTFSRLEKGSRMSSILRQKRESIGALDYDAYFKDQLEVRIDNGAQNG